jgi:hypothetical protein
MAYSKVKFKSSGDKASPCFRAFWMGKPCFLLGLFERQNLQQYIVQIREESENTTVEQLQTVN